VKPKKITPPAIARWRVRIVWRVPPDAAARRAAVARVICRAMVRETRAARGREA
jgi:hypothetical protein